jgi:hypothetical protein
MTTALVEFRCPVAGRMFGKAEPGGIGELTYSCRDCARARKAAGEHGMVIHAFDADGTFLRTVVVESKPRRA